jgi:uncharacterized protein DUF4193
VTRARRAAPTIDHERPTSRFQVPLDGDGATMRSMRVVGDREQHFTEGEPDIEPPEEFAISELDDVTQLEEELDNEDILEQDVEEGVLEETLEDLVHAGDDDELGPESPVGLVVVPAGEGEVDDDVDTDDDLEEGLDLILEHRLAIAPEFDAAGADGALDGDGARESGVVGPGVADHDEDEVRPCGPDEFTCRSCFLVHHLALLADARTMVCRDCLG